MENLKLSLNELKLMEIIWEIDKPLTSIDLRPYTKDWKNGYLQNLLKALEKKGCSSVLISFSITTNLRNNMPTR